MWVSDSFLIFAPFCLPSCLAHPLRQWLESSGGGEGTVGGLWEIHSMLVQIQTLLGPWPVPVWGLEARRWVSPFKLLLHREAGCRRDMMWKGRRKWALKTCLFAMINTYISRHVFFFSKVVASAPRYWGLSSWKLPHSTTSGTQWGVVFVLVCLVHPRVVYPPSSAPQEELFWTLEPNRKFSSHKIANSCCCRVLVKTAVQSEFP